jgi:hypothetical protein
MIRGVQLTEWRKIIYSSMLLLAIVTIASISLFNDTPDSDEKTSGLYEKIIRTNKETYELGETVEAAIVFRNNADHPLEINPIYSFSFSGNSVYEPNKISGGVFVDYASDAKIMIPANGNITFTKSSFTPTYPGPFKITGLGLTKTMNVTGYKDVTCNSTGISLKIEPSVPVLKDKENVDFSLVIVNDNPYPVKIQAPNGIEYGLRPDDKIGGMYGDLVIGHFKIEAYSQRTVWSHSFRVIYPSFSLYVYINKYIVSLEMEVEK